MYDWNNLLFEVSETDQFIFAGVAVLLIAFPSPRVGYRECELRELKKTIGAQAREATWSVKPNVRITEVQPMDQVIGASISQRRFPILTVGAVCGCCFTARRGGSLRCDCLRSDPANYGNRCAYGVGCATGQVLGMVLSHGMSLAGLGVALGVAGSFALGRFIAGLLFQVEASDPVTLSLVALVLIVVTLLACWIPARRAALLDPLSALRDE